MTVNANPYIVTSGLVLSLDASNPRSYPGTGSTWYDVSGNGYNCVFVSTPTWNSAGYFTFNGSTNYGTITNTPTINFSTSQTVLVVMNHTVSAGRKNIWNQAYGGYGTWTHEGGTYINYYYGTAGNDNVPYTNLGSGSTPNNTWIGMCITRSTATTTWYQNATAQTSMNNPYPTLTNTTANIQIGLGYTGEYWAGSISMILAYTRALSADEVAQNFNAYRGRYGI